MNFIRGKEWMIVALVAVTLVLFKLPYLSLPSYWDEASPYGEAIQWQYENGFSLLPSSMPPELSRGHPLLFHSMQALWMKIFGQSMFAARWFPLLLTVALLFATYSFCRKHLSAGAGVAAVMMIACNHIIFVQSTFMLPEIMVALFVMLAFSAWLEKKWGWWMLWATLLFLTKETSVVLGLVLFFFTLPGILKRGTFTEKIKPVIFTGLPIGILFGFFVMQKIEYGWWIFPIHSQTSSFELSVMWERLSQILFYRLFAENGMKYFTIAALVFTAYLFVYQRDLLKQKSRVLLSILAFVLAFMALHSTTEFLIRRYILCLYPLWFAAVAWLMLASLDWMKRVISIGAVSFFCFVMLRYTINDRNQDDVSLGYADRVKVQKEAINWLIENKMSQSVICTQFLFGIYSNRPSAGYIRPGQQFMQLTSKIFDNTDLIIDYDNERSSPEAIAHQGELVKEFEQRGAWVRIYRNSK